MTGYTSLNTRLAKVIINANCIVIKHRCACAASRPHLIADSYLRAAIFPSFLSPSVLVNTHIAGVSVLGQNAAKGTREGNDGLNRRETERGEENKATYRKVQLTASLWDMRISRGMQGGAPRRLDLSSIGA